MQVSEGFLYKNDGKTTWNDPDRGTLQFELPAAAQGKVEVNVRRARRSAHSPRPDPLGKPNQFKLDFPIKPGESRVDLSWNMPFQQPGVFEDHLLSKAGLIQMVAPPGVDIKGPDVTLLGQEPTTKANIFSVKGPDVQVRVEGTGLFNAPERFESSGGQWCSESRRELPQTLRPACRERDLLRFRARREMGSADASSACWPSASSCFIARAIRSRRRTELPSPPRKPPSMHAVAADGVWKYFGDYPALRGASLEVCAGRLRRAARAQRGGEDHAAPHSRQPVEALERRRSPSAAASAISATASAFTTISPPSKTSRSSAS